MSGFVHHHDLIIGAGPVAGFPLPGVLGSVEIFSVEREAQRERRLIAPPEIGPAVVRTRPDDDEVVDGAVVVVVILGEIVALTVKILEGLHDQRVTRRRRLGHGVTGVGWAVPAQRGAADFQEIVGGAAVIIAQAFIRPAGVPVAEQLGGDDARAVDGRIIREIDEQSEDLDVSFRRQAALPAGRERLRVGRFAPFEARGFQGHVPQAGLEIPDEAGVDEIVAQGQGVLQAPGKRAVPDILVDFGPRGRLEAPRETGQRQERKDEDFSADHGGKSSTAPGELQRRPGQWQGPRALPGGPLPAYSPVDTRYGRVRQAEGSSLDASGSGPGEIGI